MAIAITTSILGWVAVLLFGYAFGYRTALYHKHNKEQKNMEHYAGIASVAFMIFFVLWLVFRFIQQYI
jgi:heme/copper-type cytochrome/quinol oxidase subunit 2